MALLTIAQAKALAAKVGFAGGAVNEAVAVWLAEAPAQGKPGYIDTMARNDRGNSPAGSVDRGLAQFNSHWHSEVTDADAFDPLGAAQHTYRVSKGGADWSDWNASAGRSDRLVAQVANVDADDPGVLDAILGPLKGLGGFSDDTLKTKGGPDVGGLAGAIVSPVVNAVQGIFGQVLSDLARAGLVATFVVGGLALIVVGAWRSVAPVARKAGAPA